MEAKPHPGILLNPHAYAAPELDARFASLQLVGDTVHADL